MMNVLFTANDVVYPGLELAIYTLLTHNKHVNIYVFTMDIFVGNDHTEVHYRELSTWQKNKLRLITLYLDPSSEICFIDVTLPYVKFLSESINNGAPFTPYASLRLLADIVLTEIDHVLYLDCDTAIQANLESMYNECLTGDKDIYGSYAEEAFGGLGEFVSGVIFMKLNKMREKKYLELARKLYNENPYVYPDQMALRDAIPDIGRLSQSYGYLYPIESCGYTPAILHFTNKLTPKIFDRNNRDAYRVFYKRFPQFQYVQDGCKLIDTMFLKR